MIEFEGVSYCYPRTPHPALQDVNFGLAQGSVTALLGPNGAGKTTLLRILCGRLPGYTGSVHIPPEWALSNGHLDPAKVGVLIENPGIYSRLSVLEYLQFFGSFYPIDNLRDRIQHLCARMQLKGLHTRMGELSLGTRQKVQLIRCLLHSPPLILLDEPSSNLDPASRDVLWEMVLESSSQAGTTVLICSHQLSEMEEHCSHMGFLRAGKLLAAGPLGELRASRLGKSKVILRLASVQDAQSLDAWLAKFPGVKVEGDRLIFITDNPEQFNPTLVSELVQRGVPILELVIERPRLAELYRKLVHE